MDNDYLEEIEREAYENGGMLFRNYKDSIRQSQDLFENMIINESNINDDSIIRDVLLNNWDVNQQLKMVNDYFAYKLGLNKDEMCKTRYENFLDFRSKLKTSVTKSII